MKNGQVINAYKFVNIIGLKDCRELLLGLPDDGVDHLFEYTLAEPIERDGNCLGFDCSIRRVSAQKVKQALNDFELVEGLGGLDEAEKVLKQVIANPSIYAQKFERPALEGALARIKEGLRGE